jgi:hypothetical protein
MLVTMLMVKKVMLMRIAANAAIQLLPKPKHPVTCNTAAAAAMRACRCL